MEGGRVSDQMVSNYDLLNTIAEITGQSQVGSKDGISYAKTILGGESKVRDYTVYSSFMGPALVTNDGWKLRYFTPENVYQLYYLPNDYKEQHDLINQHPNRVEQLKVILIDECEGDLENGLFNWKKTVNYN